MKGHKKKKTNSENFMKHLKAEVYISIYKKSLYQKVYIKKFIKNYYNESLLLHSSVLSTPNLPLYMLGELVEAHFQQVLYTNCYRKTISNEFYVHF